MEIEEAVESAQVDSPEKESRMKDATLPSVPQGFATTVEAKLEALRLRVITAIRRDPSIRVIKL